MTRYSNGQPLGVGGGYPDPSDAGDYLRGDRTWADLNKAAVGLSNVDNTSDAAKPISSATQSALDAKVTGAGGNASATVVTATGGSASRTLAARFADVFNVKDYGALGDGSTNDAIAIQAAVDAAAAATNGGTIYFPAGTYLISTAILVPKSTTKGLILCGDGAASKLKGHGTYSGYYLDVGSGVSAGGVRYTIRDLGFDAPAAGTASGIRLLNANGIFLKNLYFSGMQTDIVCTTSFLVTVEDWFSVNAALYGFNATTAAHGLRIIRARLYTTGGTTGHAIRLDAASDNVVIRDNDFEYCSVALKAAGGTSFHFVGNYVEYCVNTEFDFSATVYGFQCEDNWIALRNGGATSTYDYIDGGSFTGNHLYDQKVAWGANVSGLEVGINRLTGTSTLAEAPWVTISSFQNTYSAGARTPSYQRLRDGTVRLRGEILTGTSNTVAFVLPSGYRPSQTARFAVAGTGSTNAMVIVDSANGNVTPNFPGGVTQIQLDAISFVWDPA